MSMAPSRKSTHSVMAHHGFGEMTIYRPDGAIIVLPQNQISKTTGRPRKAIQGKLEELTRENIAFLESKGVQLFVGGCNA